MNTPLDDHRDAATVDLIRRMADRWQATQQESLRVLRDKFGMTEEQAQQRLQAILATVL